MMYRIILSPEAADDIRQLKANVGAEVKDTIRKCLQHEPRKTSKARIKRLRGLSRPQYRLRVGDVRVFHDVTESVVEILAIVSKAETEAWLGRIR